MKLESPVFNSGEFIPSKYTCDGENINPELNILDIPQETRSLVLVIDDPDAPGKTFVHWTVWNISPKVKTIREDTVPEEAIEGLTDFGRPGYGGPCPPSGIHHYHFKIFALDDFLSLDSSTTLGELMKALRNHVLDQAEIIGLYQRK